MRAVGAENTSNETEADFKPASRDSDQAILGEQHEITATNPQQLRGGAQS
jgi:hypothetical protein